MHVGFYISDLYFVFCRLSFVVLFLEKQAEEFTKPLGKALGEALCRGSYSFFEKWLLGKGTYGGEGLLGRLWRGFWAPRLAQAGNS